MALTEGSIDVAGAGKALDTTEVTTGEGTVHREAVFLADPEKPQHRNRVDRKGNAAVVLGDSANLDATSRLRVSHSVTVFESAQRYGDDTLKWETVTSTGGTGAASLANSGYLLSTAVDTSGAHCQRMSKRCIRAHAGKSLLWVHTFRMGTHKTSVQTNIGIANTDGTSTLQNAVLFRRGTDGTMYFVIVSDTSGSPASVTADQSSWNLDTLDGSENEYNPSGITLSLDNTVQTVVFDLNWGSGRVRCGFIIDGRIIYCHEFNHANSGSYATVFVRTPTLAAYMNVRNQSLLASAPTGTEGTLLHLHSAAFVEGGDDQYGPTYAFGASNGATTIGVTTRRPILSVRAKTTGPNSVRNSGLIIPREIEFIASTNSAYVEIVLNGTLTGASFSAVNSSFSLAESDVSATAISGGVVIGHGYVVAGTGSGNGVLTYKEFPRNLALAYSSRVSVQDTLTIVATSVSGTSNIGAAINWDEAGI